MNINSLILYLQKIKRNNNIYVYGAGTYGNTVGKFLDRHCISWEGYIDSNEKKIGNNLNGKTIFGMNQIEKLSNIFVIVAVLPVFNGLVTEEIYIQLQKIGVEQNHIFKLTEDNALRNEIVYEVKQPQVELDRLKVLKDRFIGRRCFLVGNGPSLNKYDISKIKNELTFCCNTAFQLFRECNWKPTGYFFSDSMFWKHYGSDYVAVENLVNSCEYAFTTINTPVYEKYRCLFDNLFFTYVLYNDKIWFEEDITNALCEGGTTLYPLLQIIRYMGINEVYLLGVDFSFHKELIGGKIKINKDVKNHASGMDQINEGRYDVQRIHNAWCCARDYANQHDFKICNATKGGKLEVFERVDFDSLF